MPPNNAIPGLFPATTQMELADEMGRLGYDASGATPGKGWNEFAKMCRENPGTCATFDEVRKKLSTPDLNTPLGQIEDASNRFGKWVVGVKNQLSDTFSRSGFNPNDQEIYTNRADIKKQFFEQTLAHDIRGTPLDPLVAERMEQLMIKHPGEVDAQLTRVMNHVLSDPAKFGLQADSPGYFSSNAGVKFSAKP